MVPDGQNEAFAELESSRNEGVKMVSKRKTLGLINTLKVALPEEIYPIIMCSIDLINKRYHSFEVPRILTATRGELEMKRSSVPALTILAIYAAYMDI
jgi:hypothetical protein